MHLTKMLNYSVYSQANNPDTHWKKQFIKGVDIGQRKSVQKFSLGYLFQKETLH